MSVRPDGRGATGTAERTLAIIKPDAVRMGGVAIGEIIRAAAVGGMHPVELWMGELTRTGWELFYEEHKDKAFFPGLIRAMLDGPSIFMVLEGVFAITHWRAIMGATDPNKAEPMTLRRRFGKGGPANAVHGSASRGDYLREYPIVHRSRWEVTGDSHG